MQSGKVTAVSKEKGFGFLQPEAGDRDLFFHCASVEGGFEDLQVGEIVDYEVDPKSTKPRAKLVRRRQAASKPPTRETRRSGSSPGRAARGHKLENAELGFVTKLKFKTKLGFVSADSGGPEILFGSENVIGARPFAKLAIGDSVRFVRSAEDAEPGPPVADQVEYFERKPKRVRSPQLPDNPKARRKKPTWR